MFHVKHVAEILRMCGKGVTFCDMDEMPAVRVADIPVGEVLPEERWRLFCAYYVETGNGTQSAIRAGYSPKRARQQACEMLKKRHVQEYIRDSAGNAMARAAKEHREAVALRADEASVGEVAWIVRKLAHVIEEAPKAGQWAPAVSALQILSRMHLIFREGPTVDARSVTLNLPPGTTLEELKALRDGLLSESPVLPAPSVE